MLSGSRLMSRKMPSKNSKTLFLKHQYSITLVRVTQQGDKKMRLSVTRDKLLVVDVRPLDLISDHKYNTYNGVMV